LEVVRKSRRTSCRSNKDRPAVRAQEFHQKTRPFAAAMRGVFASLLLLFTGLAWGQQMAVTFDDLPVHGAMPPGTTRLEIAQSIVKTLKREKLPLVYGFVNGGRGEEDPSSPSVLQTWRGAGQPLGNHTWAHLDLNTESPEEFEAEVSRNEPLLRRLMGHGDWHWLRYPFLHEGDTVEKRRAVRAWLFAHGYKIAEVSMDFEDYLWNEPYARCAAKHDEPSIQKLHDSYLAVADQYYAGFRAAGAVSRERRAIRQSSECIVGSCVPGGSGYRRAAGRRVPGIDDAKEEDQVSAEFQAV
jgi:peptidoglycan/xylan/chitin deacetylase (PgdA/CDA1 family)